MARVLFTNAYVTVSVDDATGLVRYTRARVPFASMDEIRAMHNEVAALLPANTGWKLLLDLREAPARNDPAFEAEVGRVLQTILPKFSANAVLIKTAVGRLQTNRLARERGEGSPAVFGTEAEAFAFLGIS